MHASKEIFFCIKERVIRTNTFPNGRYDYKEEDVYSFLNKGVKRSIYIYARVSTSKQKKDLANQTEQLKQFFEMLDDIVSGKMERVVIMYKDRMSR